MRDTGLGQRLFRRVLFSFDAPLRQANHVFEFDRGEDCIFRASLGEMGQDFAFADGERLKAYDAVLDMHFWNEHLPQMPAKGPSLGWARAMQRAFDVSFARVAAFLSQRPDLARVKAIRTTSLLGGGERDEPLAQIMRRYGLERVPDDPAATAHFGHNALVLLFMLACNPAAARIDVLWRKECAYLMSRRVLERRYGDARPSPETRESATG